MTAAREAAATDALERLRRSPWKIALAVTGGGTGVVPICFRRGGASVNFVEAVVPYSRSALTKYLGRSPVHGSASIETAVQTAEVAFGRAAELCGSTEHAVGIALLAVLPTQPVSNETFRVCVAIRTSLINESWSRNLVDVQNRDDAETLAESMFLDAIVQLLDQ